MTGNKDVLASHLKQVIMTNVSVSKEASSAKREADMNGLDVTARWELLTHNQTPIPEPYNVDGALRPPTERDAPINPKYNTMTILYALPFWVQRRR